ncbi:MAG: hypothetical protein L6R40_004362 [Gallowayella cf. fulva]|nr:MAG: hypothetical protein L6R40_004362 [Xanthomendoza cf. fulva]
MLMTPKDMRKALYSFISTTARKEAVAQSTRNTTTPAPTLFDARIGANPRKKMAIDNLIRMMVSTNSSSEAYNVYNISYSSYHNKHNRQPDQDIPFGQHPVAPCSALATAVPIHELMINKLTRTGQH